MTWRKHSAQAASLQHRLLPTDGYQWQGMAEQHRQGPMHSCSPPPSGMSYLTQTKRHAHGGTKMKTNRWFPVKNQRKTQITRRLFLFDNSSIFLDTNSFRYFWMPKLKRAARMGHRTGGSRCWDTDGFGKCLLNFYESPGRTLTSQSWLLVEERHHTHRK